jgi:chromosome segregation ATPase
MRQKALQKEIAEGYRKEAEVLTEMLGDLSDTNRRIAEYADAIGEMQVQRERLFKVYSANLRRHNKSGVVYESVLQDFHEEDGDYREKILLFKGEIARMRDKLADISWELPNSQSFITACRKKRSSFTRRINSWTRSIRLTYDDIYSV